MSPLIAPLRELLLLTRVELRRLLRTDEVYRYVLLPALFGLPVLLFGTVLLASARGPSLTVAVPRELPSLPLVAELEGARCRVIPMADPTGAWDEGRVDAAIVGWEDGDALGRSAGPGDEPARWRFQVLARTTDDLFRLRNAIDGAGEAWLADNVALAGGSERDLNPVDLRFDLLEGQKLPFDPVRGALAYAVFSVGLLAFFLLSLPAVADRREGVTETLRTLPTRPGRMVTARVLSLAVVQLVACVFIGINLVLLALPALQSLDLPRFPWERIPGLIAALLMANAGYAVIGTLAPSARVANSTSSVPMTLQLGLLVYGVLGPAPAWVPLAGVLSATSGVEHVLATASTLAATALLLRLCGWLLETRVSLVLRRGDD